MNKIKNMGTSFSTLLKEYRETRNEAKALVDETRELITKVQLRNEWPQKRVKVNDKDSPFIEYAATVIAEQMEEASKEVTDSIEEVDKIKDGGFEFAVSSYEYLNRIYEGTPTGEMGKEILKHFKSGTLTNEKMKDLMEELEAKEVSACPPHEVQLNESQKKAIDFIIAEREERTTPVVEQLVRYKGFKDKCMRGNKILKALLKGDTITAESLLAQERELQQKYNAGE